MSIFGPVIGELPLLNLPSSKIARLDWGLHQEFHNQLKHQCIRLAWKNWANSIFSIRRILELIVCRHYMALAGVRGHKPSHHYLAIEMEHTSRMNEWGACFGFFVEDRLSNACSNGEFMDILLARDQLAAYREDARTDKLSADTVRIAHAFTKLPTLLESTPEHVSAYFELAELLLESPGK